MIRKKFLTSLSIVLTAIFAVVSLGSPVQASVTGSNVSCPFPVHIAYNTFLGPPGKAQASWENNPSSCPSKLRVEIKSNAGFTYHSGWVVSTSIGLITAATAKDGTALNWARLEVKVTATGVVWCDRVYATVGAWRKCTNPSPSLAKVDNPPVCETVQVQENPAYPNLQINYPIKLCGDTAIPIKTLVVDGGAFPEHSTTNRRVVFWSP